jgi:hypothetical protein
MPKLKLIADPTKKNERKMSVIFLKKKSFAINNETYQPKAKKIKSPIK